jgi:1-acyl-sn-glycerol-3-phosphate acyltransferase
VIFGISIYAGIKIKKTEDISQIIPVDNELKRYLDASDIVKFNERIILNIHASDSTKSVSSDSLIEYSDTLVSAFKTKIGDKILEIRNEISQNVMEDVYNIYDRNLPIFLEENDYLHIDSLLTENQINKTLEADYKSLISPTSLITKRFIGRDPLNITPIALKRLQSFQFDENYKILNDHILTRNEKNLFVFIDSKYNNSQTAENGKLLDEINLIIKNQQKKYPGIQAEIFGSPAVAVGNADRIKSDVIFTGVLALLILFTFMTLYFRKIEVFFVIYLPALLGTLFALVLMYIFQGEISSISLGIGLVFVGISIDYTLPIFVHFQTKEKPEELFTDLTWPILMSCFTTVIAFFLLLFLRSQMLRDLGMFAGLSGTFAAIFALFIVPHFLRKKIVEKEIFSENKLKGKLLDRFSAYEFHKNKYLVGIVLIISIFSFFTASDAKFETDMDKMNYMSPELRKAEADLNKISSAARRSMYLVSTGRTLNEALQNNEKVFEKIRKLKKRNIVRACMEVSPVLISDSLQKLRIKRWTQFWTFEKKEKLQQNLLEQGKQFGFKENSFVGFYQKLDNQVFKTDTAGLNRLRKMFLKDLISEHQSKSSVVMLLKLDQMSKAEVYKTIKSYENLVIVDKKYLTEKIVKVLEEDFNVLVGLSTLCVVIILFFYFGRIETGFIAMIPMALSWYWLLGFMEIFDIKFTVFNIIVSTFIFGIGIDYSIFIVQAMQDEYQSQKKNVDSYKTFAMMSTIVTIMVVGVLIFAKHPAMKSIAVLTIVGMLFVVVLTYIMLPILFNFLVNNKGIRRSAPVTLPTLFFSLAVLITFTLGSFFTIILYFFIRILPISKLYKKNIFHLWLRIMFKMSVYTPLNIKKIILNPYNENFRKQALIIANHQAIIDVPLLMMLHPKILILTKDWVQKNPVYGRIVKFADYLCVSDGLAENIEILRQKVKEGFSILVFPEGTRSEDTEIHRFHQGSFQLAQEFDLEILPILLHGTGDCIPKGEFFMKGGKVTINILQRLKPAEFGKTWREQAKSVRKHMDFIYQKMKSELEIPSYYKRKLIANYIYKGPILEHYLRVKIRLENNYSYFNTVLPKTGVITDLGCGYGFLAYMLNFTSKHRMIYGFDYDEDKITTAQNNISKNGHIEFCSADILTVKLPKSDAFVINDVLHYLTFENQDLLLKRCVENLRPGGMIVVRDGNSEETQRHKGTKLTEWFSVKFLKFNKLENRQLYFTNESRIRRFAEEHGFCVEVNDNTKLTSNTVYTLRN